MGTFGTAALLLFSSCISFFIYLFIKSVLSYLSNSIPSSTTNQPSQESEASSTEVSTASTASQPHLSDSSLNTAPPTAVTNPFLAYPRLDNLEPGVKEILRKNPLDKLWTSSPWKKRFEKKSPRDVPSDRRCRLADNSGSSCKSSLSDLYVVCDSHSLVLLFFFFCCCVVSLFFFFFCFFFFGWVGFCFIFAFFSFIFLFFFFFLFLRISCRLCGEREIERMGKSNMEKRRGR